MFNIWISLTPDRCNTLLEHFLSSIPNRISYNRYNCYKRLLVFLFNPFEYFLLSARPFIITICNIVICVFLNSAYIINGNRFYIVQIIQDTVLAVFNIFIHRRIIRCNHTSSHCHGLKEAHANSFILSRCNIEC